MKVLDPCCGSRMMWFDKSDQRCLFGDQRAETHNLKDRQYQKHLEIHPDVRIDFRNLPFADDTFAVVVFDPPHLVNAGKNSCIRTRYTTSEEYALVYFYKGLKMTKQFKFGDRVRFLPTGQIGIIRQIGNENKKWVAYFEDGDTGYFSSGFLDQIEVIPHPDTVRLDWLLKQPNYTYPGNGYDDEGEPIEGVVLRQEYNMGDSARVIGHGKDARAAIDDAMQHEANHE